jgi:hypothetical protein
MLHMQAKIEMIEGSIVGVAQPYNSPDIPPTIQAMVNEL